MNLDKLYGLQKVLRDRIGYNEPDRFNKLILALLVELSECANEWRGFKFWSVNQLPHTSAVRVPCMMDEDKEFYNPLLEEYVDGLHFILEIGLEIGNTDFDESEMNMYFDSTEPLEITEQFIVLNWIVGNIYENKCHYEQALFEFIKLGSMLGFTWEQIEQCYYEKNRINHIRQDSGY